MHHSTATVNYNQNRYFNENTLGHSQVLDCTQPRIWHKELSSGLTKQKDSDLLKLKVAKTSSFTSLK